MVSGHSFNLKLAYQVRPNCFWIGRKLRNLSRTNKLYRARIKPWFISAKCLVGGVPNAFEGRSEGCDFILAGEPTETYPRTLWTNEIQRALLGSLDGQPQTLA